MKPDPLIPEMLTRQQLLKTVAGLGDNDLQRARAVRKGVRRLVDSRNWSQEIDSLNRLGLSAKQFEGPFRDLFSFPGELILMRRGSNAFTLLQHREKRWLKLTSNGDVSELNDQADGSPVEAMILQTQSSKDAPGGFSSLAALWPELRAAWAEVGIASLFVNSGQLILPVFALLIYDKIALNGLFETLWALVLGVVIYLATDTAMRLIRNWTTERISIDLARRSDESLWEKMVAQADLPAGGFPRFLSNYRDLTQSRDFVSSSYLLAVADIPFLVLYLGVIGIIAWPLMLVVLTLALLYAGVGLALQVRQTNRSKEAEQDNTLKLAFMGESLNCLDVVRTTPGAGRFLRSWRELTEKATLSDTQRRIAAQHLSIFSTIMQTATTVILLSSGVYLIYAQMLTVGKLIACNILAGRCMAQVASLFLVTGKWHDFMRSAERMEASLAAVEKRHETPRPEIVGNIALIGIGKRFEDRPPALLDISLAMGPGERIALLGRPGAGKSTLLRCLGGLCQPDSGQIQIDGLSLEHISRFDRVKWLAYKGQDPAIFAGTLEDNLRISGCKEQDRYQLAIWASGLEAEFKSGRMSLGMQLAERGNNLSGGQRQKVALARAFAQPCRLLLLDEPTLGLDPESERLLAERLPQVLDRSAILIMTTHSPIMLNLTPRVIALEGGRVVADGPREKLVSMPVVKPAKVS